MANFINCCSCFKLRALPDGPKRADGRALCNQCSTRIADNLKRSHKKTPKTQHTEILRKDPAKYLDAVMRRAADPLD